MKQILKPVIPKKVVTTITIKTSGSVGMFDLHWIYTGKLHGRHRVMVYYESLPTSGVVIIERNLLHKELGSLYQTLLTKQQIIQCDKQEFVQKALSSMPPDYLDLIRNQ